MSSAYLIIMLMEFDTDLVIFEYNVFCITAWNWIVDGKL